LRHAIIATDKQAFVGGGLCLGAAGRTSTGDVVDSQGDAQPSWWFINASIPGHGDDSQ
jgi:hypothetical protein